MGTAAPVVAIVGTGDMGSAVGRSLVDKGIPVITALEGRTPHSRQLAQAAGMTDTGSLDDMAAQADMLLSIVPPAAAIGFAARALAVMAKSPRNSLFVDCNAVAPQTVREIATLAQTHGVRFQDAGIIGASPRPGRPPVRIYTSGPFAGELDILATDLIDVRPIGEDIGRASAIKMVYASMTKATHAIRAAAAIAGEKLGVGDEIRREWQESLPDAYSAMQDRLPRLPGVSGRWIGEMHEIAKTYESLGLTPAFHGGAAWMYRLLATVDEIGDSDIESTIERFAAALDANGST